LKAASLVDAYVEEIKEFGTTISHDTSAAIDAVTERAANVSAPSRESLHLNEISQGITTFMSGVTQLAQGVATELSELSPDRSSSPGPSADSASFTAAQLQEKMNTQDELEFREWLKSFDLASKSTETASLLASNSSIFTLHQQLVPGDLSSEEFWGRYYYKLEQAAKKEEKRLQLLDKTKKHLASPLDESEFSWDELDETDTTNATSSQTTTTATAPSSSVEAKPASSLDQPKLPKEEVSESTSLGKVGDNTMKKAAFGEIIEDPSKHDQDADIKQEDSTASSEIHTPSSEADFPNEADVIGVRHALSVASLDGAVATARNPPSPPPPTPASASSSSSSATPQDSSTPQGTSLTPVVSPLETVGEAQKEVDDAKNEDVFDWS
jgi:hypothetical protein